MKLDFNNRLKKFLINIIIREGGQDAWEHLKTLNPDCDDLGSIIVQSQFKDEAWEVFKNRSPTTEGLLYLLECSEKNKEAEAELMQRLPLDNGTLASIVQSNRSDDAAQLLLNQKPNNEQLVNIMEHTKLYDQAAQMLFTQSPDNDDLSSIIQYSSLKREAWEQLLKQSPTNEELISIVQFTDWEEVAWEYLLQQNPTNEELMGLANDYSETGRKMKEAAEWVLQNSPGIDELIDLIRRDHFADEAWKKLKAHAPTCGDIECLIRLATVKANEAAAWCLKLNPDKDMLWTILGGSDHKDEAALQLIQMPLELYELAEIVVASSIEPVLALLSERAKFDRSKVDEEELVQEIAEKLLHDPALLNVNHWHEGETHCFGGWAIALNQEAQAIEKQYGSEIAACLLLPRYTHLFFADQQTVMDELQKVALTS